MRKRNTKLRKLFICFMADFEKLYMAKYRSGCRNKVEPMRAINEFEECRHLIIADALGSL